MVQNCLRNTCFQKKLIHYGTWMHPATKLHYMIDFIVMRSGQQMCCLDVQVMRGANCCTDHHMMRAKLRLVLPQSRGAHEQPLLFAVHRLASMEFRDMQLRSLKQSLGDCGPSSAFSAEEHENLVLS